jgi:hypothetical protein
MEKGEFNEQFLSLTEVNEKNEQIYNSYSTEYDHLIDKNKIRQESINNKNKENKLNINNSEIVEDMNFSSLINEDDIFLDSNEINKLNSNNFSDIKYDSFIASNGTIKYNTSKQVNSVDDKNVQNANANIYRDFTEGIKTINSLFI